MNPPEYVESVHGYVYDGKTYDDAEQAYIAYASTLRTEIERLQTQLNEVTNDRMTDECRNLAGD